MSAGFCAFDGRWKLNPALSPRPITRPTSSNAKDPRSTVAGNALQGVAIHRVPPSLWGCRAVSARKQDQVPSVVGSVTSESIIGRRDSPAHATVGRMKQGRWLRESSLLRDETRRMRSPAPPAARLSGRLTRAYPAPHARTGGRLFPLDAHLGAESERTGGRASGASPHVSDLARGTASQLFIVGDLLTSGSNIAPRFRADISPHLACCAPARLRGRDPYLNGNHDFWLGPSCVTSSACARIATGSRSLAGTSHLAPSRRRPDRRRSRLPRPQAGAAQPGGASRVRPAPSRPRHPTRPHVSRGPRLARGTPARRRPSVARGRRPRFRAGFDT